MIKDEFEELLTAIAAGVDKQDKTRTDEVIFRMYRFFNRLKEELKTARPEEKRELVSMIKVMQEKISEFSKKSAQKVGLSEEEILRRSDDGRFFTPDQRRVLEMAKNDMLESSQQLRSYVDGTPPPSPSIDQSDKPKKKGSGKRRSAWKKS